MKKEQYELRFFDRFDDEAREFEDQIRHQSGSLDLEANAKVEDDRPGSVLWPALSLNQTYAYLESSGKKFFVLQMHHRKTGSRFQISIQVDQIRFLGWELGFVSQWTPSLKLEDRSEVLFMIRQLQDLCREHTKLMSLRVCIYLPGHNHLNLAQQLYFTDAWVSVGPSRHPKSTRLMDLRQSPEALWQKFSTKLRTKIKSLKERELDYHRVESMNETSALQAALMDSYRRTTQQNLHFDLSSTVKMSLKYPNSSIFLAGYFKDQPETPQAFLAGMIHGKICENAVAGSKSDKRLRHYSFNYQLVWKMIQMAQERNLELLDMGGITDESKEDPLSGISNFKRRFPGFELEVGREFEIILNTQKNLIHGLLKKLKSRGPKN